MHPGTTPFSAASIAVVVALTLIFVGVLPAPLAAVETELPLPRFVSLRASEANIRTGPGVRYPVEWVYRRRAMPLEITAEFENWRKVRDWEGTEGWMHKSMLSGRRTLLVTGAVRAIRRAADEDAPIVARAEPGIIGALLNCAGKWCRIDVQGHKGWLRHGGFWGAYPGEAVD